MLSIKLTLLANFLLAEIDDELEKAKVSFVKIQEEGAEEQFGILELPALTFIQNGIPNIYEGDLVTFNITYGTNFKELK